MLLVMLAASRCGWCLRVPVYHNIAGLPLLTYVKVVEFEHMKENEWYSEENDMKRTSTIYCRRRKKINKSNRCTYTIFSSCFLKEKPELSNLNHKTNKVAQAHGQNNNTSKKNFHIGRKKVKKIKVFRCCFFKGGESLRIGEFPFLQLQPTVSRASRIFQLEGIIT